MSKEKDVFIKIETMARNHDAALVSLSAVTFDTSAVSNPIRSEYLTLFDWAEQDFDYGRTIDKETLEFWKGRPKVAQAMLKGAADLQEGLSHFGVWFEKNTTKDAKVWSQNPTFDIVILERAFEACALSVPWSFYNLESYPTIKNLFSANRGELRAPRHDLSNDPRDTARILAASIAKMRHKLISK